MNKNCAGRARAFFDTRFKNRIQCLLFIDNRQHSFSNVASTVPNAILISYHLGTVTKVIG